MFNGEIGNPDLRPEKSKTLNASVGGQGSGWSWELIGFARETRNLIDLSGETPDPDVFQFINLPGKVKARGFEAVGNVDVAPWLSLQGSYTHTRTRPQGTNLQLAGVPKDFAQAVVDFHRKAVRSAARSSATTWAASSTPSPAASAGSSAASMRWSTSPAT